MGPATRRFDELAVPANDPRTAYPSDMSVVHLIFEQASRTPAATAVVCGEHALTYAQLETDSNRLARELSARGIGSGTSLGLLLERSTDLVVAIVAILKSGAAYIPLDPSYPIDRIAYACENSRVGAIITKSTVAAARHLADLPLLCIDTEAGAIAERSGAPICAHLQPDDLAYMIYTSGSTGRPKGVKIHHRALMNFVYAIGHSCGFRIGPRDVLVAVTTIAFDMAVLEIFVPLTTGACVVIAEEAELLDMPALLTLLQRRGATIMQATPISWQLLIEAGWTGDPALKMITGGEALSRKLAEALLVRGVELWNGYGPTETTVYSAFAQVFRGSGPVRLGAAMPNQQFYVVGEAGQPVASGETGELVIGGDGVARGYFERPDLTAERFLPDRFRDIAGALLYRTGDIVRACDDGTFEYLGRSDHQVKLRGFRIELGEIEATLGRLPGVKDAVVVVHGSDDDRSLCAFVVLESTIASGEEWLTTLRAGVALSLPHYMVPARFVAIDAFPRTPNNKVDRSALKAPDNASGAVVERATWSPTEIELAAHVSRLLGGMDVERDIDLFSIGFHSLLAARLSTAIRTAFGVSLRVRVVFDHPTIARLARIIDDPSSLVLCDDVLPITRFNPSGTQLPFIYFHSDVLDDGRYCKRLAELVGADQPIYAISPHGTAGLTLLPTVEEIACDILHGLRAAQPNGPYRLGGFCAGGYIAYEVARQLRAEGEIVERLILINASAPYRQTHIDAGPLIHVIGRNARLSPQLREALCHNLAHLADALNAGPRGVCAFVANRLRALKNRGHRSTAVVEPFEKHKGTRETELYLAQVATTLRYHALPYGGALDLVWSTDQTSTHDALLSGWGELASEVRMIPMPGGHISPLHDHIDELGAVLRDLL
jgi:amino acid adenylation domain-containing protein